MSRFLTDLKIDLIEKDNLWELQEPLIYDSDLIGRVEVPAGFVTDLASVPRVPFVYWWWGGMAHREAVIHDYLYRQNSQPVVSYSMANRVFLEAMECRGKPFFVRWPMFIGVALGGFSSYHESLV